MGSGAGVIVGSVGETAELCTSDVHRAWNRANATSGFMVYILESKLPVNYEVCLIPKTLQTQKSFDRGSFEKEGGDWAHEMAAGG